MSMRMTVLRYVPCVLLILTHVPAYSQSPATNLAPVKNVNAATNVRSASTNNRSALPNPVAALEARVRVLESEVLKLWRYAASLKAQIPSQQAIAGIADRRASILVNKYLGGKADDPTRMPFSSAEGGVSLAHIVVGLDRASEVMDDKGLRVAIAGRGPKKTGNALVTVYALPLADPVLRPSWLVHADGNVPYLDGVVQAHFVWKGHFADGKKAAAGKYRIFVRVIANETNGNRIGGAMRWWGGTDTASSVVVIR